MSATFGALRGDDVGAGRLCAERLGRRAGHVHHHASRLVRAIEERSQILIGPRPGGGKHRRRRGKRGVDRRVMRPEQQEVDGKRPQRRFPNGCDLG